ncbi:MAG: bifunctional folylpolyglutamate synthase/dihydrofolate synthase [Proteobacteria bacterium]|nr:bifunctional folylpolyglutamate synthase/dihydrofolate synthase [Pseudomonadota bacterium]
MANNVFRYLYSLEKYGILLGLENIEIILSLIGNPEKKLKTVHIVGTNGKGSTASFLSKILMSGGYKVGVYTSPHLIKFNERIKINNRLISDKDIEKIAFHIKEQIDKSKHKERPYTFFEVTTALAFKYFYEKKVDIAVIEAGLGGRLDATNVLNPFLTIITNVGLEHKEFLGDTLEKIAFEKGSVIKKSTPVITAVEESGPLQVISNIADERQAPLFVLGRDFNFQRKNLFEFDYHGIKKKLKNLKLKNLIGINQFKNASLALAGVEILTNKGFKLSLESIKSGISNATWEGRFEIIRKRPPFIIDGAHNPHGVKALIENINHFYPDKRFIFILNVLKDKDIHEMIDSIIPYATNIYLCPNKNDRSYSAVELRNLFANKEPFLVFDDIPSAIDFAFSKRLPTIFTGSLYGIGEAKEYLKKC